MLGVAGRSGSCAHGQHAEGGLEAAGGLTQRNHDGAVRGDGTLPLKDDVAVAVVEADVGEATLYGLHYDLLDLLEGKAQKVPERLEAHRGVDPPELLHHLQHCQALQGLRVLLKACLLGGEPGGEDHLGTQGLDGGHLRLGLRVHPHGVELALEEMEDAPHLGRAEVKEALGPELRDQRGARDHRRGARLVLETEDRGDAFLLLPRELRVVNTPDGRAVVGQHREGSQDAVRGHEAQVALLQGLVVLPGQGVYLVPGVGVVELAVRGPEDLLETRVVGHHREGVRLAPCEGLERVDRYRLSVSGFVMSGRSRWSLKRLRLVRWRRIRSQSRRNSGPRLYITQKLYARCAAAA